MKKDISLHNTSPKAPSGSRNNNFNIIRIIATLFVFSGHMGMILGIQPPLLAGFRLHELGVGMLFLISGYLITMSWLSDPNPLRYSIRRFLRLWPPFAVMVLIMTFAAGPLLSNLGIQGYFHSWYKAYLQNLRFFIVFAQPGVFENLPIPYTTNGSLWTMPVEAFLYVITPILLTVARVKKRSRYSFYVMTIVTGTAIGFDLVIRLFWSDLNVVLYGTDLISAYHLAVFYLIGILFTYEETRKYLNMQLASVAMCLLFVFQLSSDAWSHLLLYLIFPYFIFSFVFAKNPLFGKLGQKMELSYGIYLYGFFFQQLIVSWQLKYGMTPGYIKSLILSFLPTFAAAYLSFVFVEKPVLILSKSLIRKIKPTKSEPRT